MHDLRFHFRFRRPRPATLLVFLIAGIAACSGQSCSCIQPIKGGFPLAQRRENGVQTRLSKSFLQYVGDNATTILPGLLPSGSTFNVPPVCSGSNKICCTNPPVSCQLTVDPRGLTLTPSAPDNLHFDAHLLVKSVQNIPVDTSLGHCVISIDSTRAGAPTIRAQGDVQLPVNADTRLTGLALANPTIDDIDDGDLNLNEAGSDSVCSVANVGFIKGFIIDYLKGQVGSMLSGVVENQLCQSCNTKDDCSQVATACTDHKCIGPDGKQCVQLLGIEGRADVGSFLASYSPNTRAYVDLLEAAGGYVLADTGLSLGVLGGSRSDPHHACVPLVNPPAAVSVAPSASFQGDLIPGTTTPYHVGIGVHISHLTDLGYAFWDSGGLCLGVGSDKVSQLSASTLGIIMPSMIQLLRTENAPMSLQLRPQMPPSFKLGKGTFKMQGAMKVVDDPLLTIGVKDLAADFYLFIDDRYVRVATVTTDLSLPLGIDTDASGALVLLTGDVGKAFSNIRVSNSELLAETVPELEAAFPIVFSAAVAPLLSSLPKFALPTFAGLKIKPKVITSTDADAMGAGQYLAIYADVASATTIERNTQTSARIVEVRTPPTEVFSVHGRDGRVPGVTVEVAGALDDRPSEWSWSIDGGPWHVFQPAGTLTLEDSVLWLQGRHLLSVRARAVGAPETLDATPVELPFFIDSEPPQGDFTLEGGQIVVHASDRVSPSEALVYRVDGGPLQKSPVFSAVAHAPTAKVEVRDEAGHFTVVPYRGTLPLGSFGCELGGRGPGGLLGVAFVLGVLVLRRRRALALVALLGACTHHAAGQSDQLDPADLIGRAHDVRFHDGALHVSAYDQSFGDLAYAQISIDHLSDPIEWILVDGWDPSAAQDTMGPFRHKSQAPGPDVGFYSSLQLTQDGDPRIAYFDATLHLVKFAAGPFPFETHAIDRGSETIEVGQWAALVMDLYDHPIVAYTAVGLGDGSSGFRSELRVAQSSDPSPNGAQSWQISVVDQAPISCGGRCDAASACILSPMVGGMPNSNPAYSTCRAVDLGPCSPGCAADQACVQGACKDIVRPNAVGGLPEGTGLFAKLVRGPSSEIALAYYDRTRGELRVAFRGGDGKFLPATIDGADPGADLGQHVSAVYDDKGTLHLAYQDVVPAQLVYRSISAGGAPSARTMIDNGVRDDGPHPVGASASIVTVGGLPSVLYQDQASADLELASGPNPWSHALLRAGAEGLGFSSHQVSGDGARYYTSWVFDRSAAKLGRLLVDRIK